MKTMTRDQSTTKKITATDVAERVGVSVRTLNRMADDGRIVAAAKAPGLRGGYLYEPAEVERVAAEQVAS